MAHVTVQSVELPTLVLTNAASKSEAHRKLLSFALNKSLLPVIPESTVPLGLHLHPDVHAKLSQAAAKHGMSDSVAFGCLVNAALINLQAAEKSDHKHINAIKGDFEQLLLVGGAKAEKRPDQCKFWMNLASELALGKVVMAEASTGVGKGICIVSAAVMAVNQGKTPVVIAAPTIKTLTQLWKEFASAPVQKKAKSITASFLPGKQEFVDDILLKEYVDLSPSPHVEIKAWIEAGAPSRCGSALSDSSTRAGITPRWLVEDLKLIAPDIRAEDFAISENSSPDCKGAEQLAIFKAAAAEADIVFCTQTMLARLSLIGWSMLPKITEADEDGVRINTPVFLIDEAHLFESTMASVASKALSLHSLRSRMVSARKKMGAGPSSALGKGSNALRKLMNICTDAYSGDEINLGKSGGDDQGLALSLLGPVRALQGILKTGGSMGKVARIKDDREAISALLKVLSGEAQDKCTLSFSPHIHYPLFSMGPSSVKGKLANVWSAASGGVGLVSATFWLPSWNGTPRVNYMRDILNLPIERVSTPSPVEWKEIYIAPKRYLPSKAIAGRLAPPSQPTPESIDLWCQNQAGYIYDFFLTAKGGTLVLCTSYDQIKSLSKHLVAAGIDEVQLVVNSGSLVKDQKKYIEIHASGVKPVWLVLGPGWTGVDLVQTELGEDGELHPVDPSVDTLLTDLIITRIPFGLNRSLTQLARVERNFKSTTDEAMLLLKQGLGRLIRRSGLKDRRVILLDGRLQQSNLSTYMSSAVRDAYLLLGKYGKKAIFPI